MRIDITRAHVPTVVYNHERDPNYTPYCMRCSGFQRMLKVKPFLWKHYCGAMHDERQVIVK